MCFHHNRKELNMGIREPSDVSDINQYRVKNEVKHEMVVITELKTNYKINFKNDCLDSNENECSISNKDKIVLRKEIDPEIDSTDVSVCRRSVCKTRPNSSLKTNVKKLASGRENVLFLLLRIMISLTVVLKQWTLIYILITCVSAYREQRFAIEPQDQVS